MTPQHTIAQPVEIGGIGLHTGAQVHARLSPAPAGSGVRFRPMGAEGPGLPALACHVTNTQLATTLGDGEFSVSTVEHLLATLLGQELDNLTIEVEGPELPVLDGSGKPWTALLDQAGRVAQSAPRRCFRVEKTIEVRQAVRGGPDRVARLVPAQGFSVWARIDFDHPDIGTQELELALTPESFAAELGWARTFGFLRDVEALHRMGLARGGSLDNVVVFGPEGIMNPEGLRDPREPVRHKILDILGDLALLGLRIEGRCEAERPGHGLTHELVGALLADPSAFCIMDC
jgi:UDP-3-O-[3-hydroxymyristoyl] N-acetylglucosamine deacetylase